VNRSARPDFRYAFTFEQLKAFLEPMSVFRRDAALRDLLDVLVRNGNAAIIEAKPGPPVDLDRLEELSAAAFCAPWTASTFEIDCPCPNGVDCGDPHSCEVVEALEEYPDSPEEPAQAGQGQCIVQISVPGLDRFAKANGALITALRNNVGAIVRELRAARDIVSIIREMKKSGIAADRLQRALVHYDTAMEQG